MGNWKRYKCGDNELSYDHSILNTPFGRFLITWKSWKSFPKYDVEESPIESLCFNIHENSLEETQKECERLYQKAISKSMNEHNRG